MLDSFVYLYLDVLNDEAEVLGWKYNHMTIFEGLSCILSCVSFQGAVFQCTNKAMPAASVVTTVCTLIKVLTSLFPK